MSKRSKPSPPNTVDDPFAPITPADTAPVESDARSVRIESVRAIGEPLHIRLPERGGFVVLQGDQGVGKSTVLRAVRGALGEKDTDLEPADGAERGRVEAFGRTGTVTASMTRWGGELVVRALSGGDPSKFIDPGIDNAEKADAARMREVALLLGVKIPNNVWHTFLDGEPAPAALSSDPVEAARQVRALLHDRARGCERRADEARGEARELRASLPAKSMERPPTEEEARRAMADAITNRTRMEERKAAADKARALPIPKWTGGAASPVKDVEAFLSEALQRVDELRTELAKAREYEAFTAGKRAQEQARADAIANEPSPEDLQQAEVDVEDAEKLHTLMVRERDAGAKRSKLAEAEQNITRFAARADALRDRASEADGVLAKAVSERLPHGLVWHEGRFWVKSADREKGIELLSDLSDGERIRLGLLLAANAVGEGGVFVIDQAVLGELSTTTIEELRKELEAKGVTCVSARATPGPLSVEGAS